MDAFITALSKQNPYFDVPCHNPDCGEKTKVKTEDYFSHDICILSCPYCGKTTKHIGIDKAIANLKEQFSSSGITW